MNIEAKLASEVLFSYCKMAGIGTEDFIVSDLAYGLDSRESCKPEFDPEKGMLALCVIQAKILVYAPPEYILSRLYISIDCLARELAGNAGLL